MMTKKYDDSPRAGAGKYHFVFLILREPRYTGGMTAFSLQVTSVNGVLKEDADQLYNEMMQYWDKEEAGAELQVAMEKMSWPTCPDLPAQAAISPDVMSRPSKQSKAS
jgi:hypothetical protein